MAQHDYVIANGTGAAVRSDLNGGLAAIVSQNSGATAPSTTYAYQSWADTSAGVMKMRNGANNAWISLYELDGTFLAGDISLSGGAVATPSLFFTGDTNTGIYSPGADQVGISTGGTSRFEVSTTAVSSTLPVVHPLGAVGTPSITFTGDLNTGIWSPAADTIAFSEGGAEAMRIDSSGRLLVGTSSARSFAAITSKLQIEGTEFNTSSISLANNSNDVQPAYLTFGKSRAGSLDGNTVVQNGDFLGIIQFAGADGTDVQTNAATIACKVDGTPGANDMPGRLVFSTTADGAASPTERMRIDSTGLMTLAGPGIKFPATQVASTDPNTLDDYEEGTWTPTQGTGVTVVGTFSSVGSYVKIGKQVSFAGYITAVTSVAFNPAGGNLAGGLPFSVLSGIGCAVAQNAAGSVMIIAIPAGTVISGQSSVAATSVIYFSGTYPI